jgi:broad specificity phosphatase PhoE
MHACARNTRTAVCVDELEEGNSDAERRGEGDPVVESHVRQLIASWRRTQRRTQVVHVFSRGLCVRALLGMFEKREMFLLCLCVRCVL